MTRPSRVGLVHVTLALFAIAIVVKAAHVQLGQRARWVARAERQQSTERVVPAPRGDILDADGQMLAQSRETVKLDVAPPQVHTGCFGGQMQSRLQSRKACFTSRSSPE